VTGRLPFTLSTRNTVPLYASLGKIRRPLALESLRSVSRARYFRRKASGHDVWMDILPSANGIHLPSQVFLIHHREIQSRSAGLRRPASATTAGTPSKTSRKRSTTPKTEYCTGKLFFYEKSHITLHDLQIARECPDLLGNGNLDPHAVGPD
jgi:hypothetical protein